jgi:hypothetical protein
VLLAVPHVTNDQAFPAFDYPIMPENYQRRFLVKTPEQLEAEAREAKIKENARKAAEAVTFTSMLSYFGLMSAPDTVEDTAAGTGDAATGAAAEEVEETAELPGANVRIPKDEKIDLRPLQMAIPAPVAFKHLTCVSSYRHVVHEMPEGFDDCPEAEHTSYDSAKPRLTELHKEYEYQSMVHKIKAAGNTRQVRFEAAAFDLKAHDQRRSRSTNYSQYALPYEDDLSSEAGTQVTQQTASSLDDKEYGLIAAGLTLQKIVPKYQRSLTVIARPAFVIKSRRSKDNREKVFINVLHHMVVDDLIESGLVLLEPHEVPLTGVGDSFVCKDRDGVKSIVYNVLIASSYIKTNYRKYEQKITDALCIKQVRRRDFGCCAIFFFPLCPFLSCGVTEMTDFPALDMVKTISFLALTAGNCHFPLHLDDRDHQRGVSRKHLSGRIYSAAHPPLVQGRKPTVPYDVYVQNPQAYQSHQVRGHARDPAEGSRQGRQQAQEHEQCHPSVLRAGGERTGPD